MSTKIILSIIAFIGIFHIFIAFLSTIELKDYPLLSSSKKTMWFFVIWFTPFIGTLLFHRNIGLGWGSMGHSSGDASTGGYSGSDGD